jgi:ankyrin repeat protein
MKRAIIAALSAALLFGAPVMAAEIHDAVRKGDAAEVSRLLKKTSKSGGTPLMNAASYGRLETVTLLLDAGAKVNGTETKMGLTALMAAALAGRTPPSDLRTGNQSLGNCGPLADYSVIVTLLLENKVNRLRKPSITTPLPP